MQVYCFIDGCLAMRLLSDQESSALSKADRSLARDG